MNDQATAATEIATRTADTAPATYQANDVIYDIIRASRDPSVDAAKTTALANLAMQMQDREAERRFRMAKHRALLEMPRISKKGEITNKAGGVQSHYSKFEDIDRAVRPVLAAHNLIISFNVDHEGAMVTVQPVLAYSDGELAYEERGGHMVLAIDSSGSKNATQGAGSSASYGKRHAMKAILNIIEDGEDNDGQGKSAYEALPDEKRELIDQSRSEAMKGVEAYVAYFKTLSVEQRGFLSFNLAEEGETWHEQNKRCASQIDAQQ